MSAAAYEVQVPCPSDPFESTGAIHQLETPVPDHAVPNLAPKPQKRSLRFPCGVALSGATEVDLTVDLPVDRSSTRNPHVQALCGAMPEPTPPPHHRYVDGVGSGMLWEYRDGLIGRTDEQAFPDFPGSDGTRRHAAAARN